MARGRQSFFICERSGFKLPYKKMRKQWDGLMVGPEDYDSKHPQLEIPHIRPDNQVLKNARPDSDDDGGVSEQLSEYFPGTFGETG